MKTLCNLLLVAAFHLMVSNQTLHAQKIRLKVLGQKDTTVNLIKYFGKGLYYACLLYTSPSPRD